jgi:PhnB protein
MTQLCPYLTFSGNCFEAMHFYKTCLGGELSFQTVEESPMAKQWPIDVQKHILHAELKNNGITLFASDMGGADIPVNGNTMSLALTFSSKEEIERVFKNLSAGANVTHPLHTFFDGTIAALIDKYGKNWLLKF